MPRRPVVSRTFNLLLVNLIRTDVNKEKVVKENKIILDLGFKTNEDILKYIREQYDTPWIVTSRVRSADKVVGNVSMEIQTFFNNAEKIDIKKGE